MSARIVITAIISVLLMTATGFFLLGNNIPWSGKTIYALHLILAVYFFAVLVSNQRFEEDLLARTQRAGSAILFSYVFFFELLYAPAARYIFTDLVRKSFFGSDLLALFLFLIFLFLFGTAALLLNSFARFGFLANWRIFNNNAAYFVLRGFWFSTILLAIFLYLLQPFIIISA